MRLIGMIVVILVVLGFALVPSAPATLDEGLVLYFPFDTDAGGTVVDRSGVGNDGIVYGATFSINGRSGGAYFFDGTDDSIIVPEDPTLNVPDHFSLSAFFKVTDYVEQRPILQWFDIKTGKPGVHMWTGTTGYQWQGRGTGAHLCGIDGVEDNLDRVISVDDPPANEWHHLVVTYDRLSSTGQLFLDGQLLKTQNMGSFFPQMSYPLYIGACPGLTIIPEVKFYGLLDEIRIYNRVITAEEVAELYTTRPPIDPPYITLIGFSKQPKGDQDVTEFYKDETIYIRVRDVDIEDIGAVRILFYQPRSRTFSVTLTRNSDGTYTGSIPARRFNPGKVTVRIMGARGWGLKFMKLTELMIRAVPSGR